MKKLFIYALFIGVTQFAYANDLTPEQIKAIDTFLSEASDDVKASLKADLVKGVIGYTNPITLATRDYSDHEKLYVLGRVDQLDTMFVTHINLCKFGLRALPDNLFLTEGLVELLLDRNQLTTIPASIKDAKTLQVLDVADNRLRQVPAEITQLKKIAFIDFSDNKIASFPPQFLTFEPDQPCEIYLLRNSFTQENISPELQHMNQKTIEWRKGFPYTKEIQVRVPAVIQSYVEKHPHGKKVIKDVVVKPEEHKKMTFRMKNRGPQPRVCLVLNESDLQEN